MRLSLRALSFRYWRLAENPVRFFALVTLVFGIGFILLVPPFQIPDEFTHFTRAYEVSELKTAHVFRTKQIDHLGSMMPRSILLTYKKTSLHLTPGSPDVAQAKKYHLSETKEAFRIPLNKSVVAFYDTGASPSYFPLLYLPQAITIRILSMLNAPVIVMLYATRIAGLLLWLALAIMAFRFLRPTKRAAALASILLLPMFIAQASASTDPLINGLVILYLALLTRDFIDNRRLTLANLFLYTLILTLMTLSKPVYGVFGLLLFALPAVSKNLKLHSWYKIGALLLPFILFICWSTFTKTPGGPYFVDSIAISGAAPSVQAHYIIPNVLNFVEPFTNTLFLGWGDNIFVSMLGDFGKLDTPLPLIFVILGYAVIAVALFAGIGANTETAVAQRFYLKKKVVLTTVVAALLYFSGVYLAMYLYSTPAKEKIITGVQGRYFLPLLLLGLLFTPKHFVTIKEKIYYRILEFGPVILLIVSVLVIYLRFYPQYP